MNNYRYICSYNKKTIHRPQTNKQNNIEQLIIGTIPTSNSHFDNTLYLKYKNRRDTDTSQFKDKSKYLQNIPYKAIHDNDKFNKQIRTADDLVLFHINKQTNKKTIEKNIAQVINNRKKFDINRSREFTDANKKKYEQEFKNELNNRFINIHHNNNMDLKKDSYKYHEQCQQELEKNKENIDLIINQLLDNNFLN